MQKKKQKTLDGGLNIYFCNDTIAVFYRILLQAFVDHLLSAQDDCYEYIQVLSNFGASFMEIGEVKLKVNLPLAVFYALATT